MKNKIPKLTAKDIINKKNYRGILEFTYQFDRGEGLYQRHYRWGLIKDHDNIKSTNFIKNIEKYELRVKNRIKIKNGLLVRSNTMKDYYNPIITSRINLSNLIRNLSSPPNNYLIKKNIDKKHPCYCLSEIAIYILQLEHIIEMIKAVPQDLIEELDKHIQLYFIFPFLKHLKKKEKETYDDNSITSKEVLDEIRKDFLEFKDFFKGYALADLVLENL
jgi:hypothetical protein